MSDVAALLIAGAVGALSAWGAQVIGAMLTARTERAKWRREDRRSVYGVTLRHVDQSLRLLEVLGNVEPSDRAAADAASAAFNAHSARQSDVIADLILVGSAKTLRAVWDLEAWVNDVALPHLETYLCPMSEQRDEEARVRQALDLTAARTDELWRSRWQVMKRDDLHKRREAIVAAMRDDLIS